MIIKRTTQEIINEVKKNISNKDKDKFIDSIIKFQVFLKKFNPELFLSKVNGKISKNEITIVMDEIKQSGDFGVIIFLRDLYDLIIKNLCESYGWKSAPVHHFIIRRRYASRFSTFTFKISQEFEYIENIFWRAVVDLKTLSSVQRKSLIIISASIYGAILDKYVLISLANKNLDNISSFHEYIWIELEVNEQKAVPGTIQRWFGDPISAQLLRGYKLESKKRTSKLKITDFTSSDNQWDEGSLWSNILELLTKYSYAGELLPKSLSNYINWVRSDFNSSLPSYLVDVSSGVYPSYSMLKDAWWRSVSGNPTVYTHDISNVNTYEKKYFSEVYKNSREVVSSSETNYFIKLKKLIKLNDVDGYKNLFHQIKDKISSTTKYICEYYLILLEGNALGRFQHKAKSIEKYFSFSEELIAFAQGRDIVKMHIDNIESLYDEVFEKQTNIKRQSKAGVFLKYFHNYLVKVYEVEKLIFEELEGFIPDRHSVNSNVICPQHYNEVLIALWPSYSFDDRLCYIRYSMTALGYRLNMRRQEIRRLRLCDVRILKTQFFVRVVNTEEGNTKSLSGWRWVPAHDLFDDKELLFFKKWHKQRTYETTNRRALLFTELPSNLNMISVYKTFDVMLKIIRSVTGDPRIRFHSLRHSFATWLLISIEANRLPNIIDTRFSIFSGESGLKPANFKTLIDGTKPTKKILYQLALIMGHSSPSMTLLHYVHSCDWLLYHWCCKRLPRLTVDKISPLLGVNKREVNKILKERKLLDQNKTADLVECLTSYDGWKLKPEWNNL